MYQFRKEYNAEYGVTETYYWDDATKTMTVKNSYDVGDIIESNKRRANNSLDKRFGNEMLHHFAEIPNGVIELWAKEGLDVFSNDPAMQKRILRKLHDPEWKYLRTTVKKVL
jgi:hypothetical protein